MISVVNGFVCMSSCDVAKAKKGENPSKPPGQLDGAANADPAKPGARANDPAVIFSGSLQDALAANPVAPASAPAIPVAATPQPSFSLLV
ncbi:MAG: hypothetical protein WCI56_05950 [Hyphomicrobiales bacterium]